MAEGRTLQPGDEISHYRIVGPLGVGGMGEVYRAQDLTLERNVALKVLPATLVKNPERVRRFVLEAKSASSLNHPNIVTIYEIGQEPIRSGGGADATPSDPVHFISMELVSGQTLGALIHEEKTDLRTLLGYLAQAAEGIAKAHAAGIVHRDLKPGNIMVTPDGFAKVLDFGLAKLTEKRQADAELSSMATMSPEATGEGVVLGTAGYMSPEQVQGKAIDHRSDVFSFGCLIYEATTRQRPFAAESGLETMHRIVNEKPAQIEDLNPDAPAELRRLIRRSLAKNPEQRLQSMKDLALELREIVDEFDTLSASGTSGTMASGATAAAGGGRRMRVPVLVGVALVIGVAGILAGVWGWQRTSRDEPGSAFASMRVSTLTNVGDASDGVLSPDGRYLAYASGPGDERKLWVRQISTGSDVEVLRLNEMRASGLVFSPDGDYLYFLALDPEHTGYRALYRVPSLGGAPQKQIYDIDSPISFEPSGERGCFHRGVPEEQADHIVLLNMATREEQVLAKIHAPRELRAGPAWSPAGDRIAIAEAKPEDGLNAHIVTFDVADGRRDSLQSDWPIIESIAWYADGRGLLVAGLDLSGSPVTQVFSVDLPRERIQRLTNDYNYYWGISLSADGRSISAMRRVLAANVWAISADGSGARQITFSSGTQTGSRGIDVLPSGDLVYTAPQDQYFRLFATDPEGGDTRTLTPGPSYVPIFGTDPTGVVAVLTQKEGDQLVSHLWHLDDSGERRQLTRGEGEFLYDVHQASGAVLFRRNTAPNELWLLPAGESEPRKIFDYTYGIARFSRDGTQVLSSTSASANGMMTFQEVVIPLTGGEPRVLANSPPQSFNAAWHPSGEGYTCVFIGDGARNLIYVPLDGTTPRPITRFAEGRVSGYRWSPDGQRILVVRRTGRSENLWIVDADGANARQLTSFQSGEIFGVTWSLDGTSVYFGFGESNSDVVLLRSTES